MKIMISNFVFKKMSFAKVKFIIFKKILEKFEKNQSKLNNDL